MSVRLLKTLKRISKKKSDAHTSEKGKAVFERLERKRLALSELLRVRQREVSDIYLCSVCESILAVLAHPIGQTAPAGPVVSAVPAAHAHAHQHPHPHPHVHPQPHSQPPPATAQQPDHAPVAADVLQRSLEPGNGVAHVHVPDQIPAAAKLTKGQKKKAKQKKKRELKRNAA